MLTQVHQHGNIASQAHMIYTCPLRGLEQEIEGIMKGQITFLYFN